MRIGIIGQGSIGKRHKSNLLAIGASVRTCDIAEDADCKTVEELLRLDLDAMIVCSPPQYHYEHAFAALVARLACFVEKPLVHTWDHAHMILECNKDWKMTIAVGYQLRWQIHGVPSGNLTIESSQDMSQWPSQYEKDALLEFSHEIDTAVYINGPVMRVSASESVSGWHILLRHMFHETEIFINPYAKSYARDIYRSNRDHSKRMKAWSFSHEENEEAYKLELQAFLEVCRGGVWDDRLCTLAQAAHIMKIIDACKRSAKNCEVIQL